MQTTINSTGDRPVVLVTGATGRQGGAVARHLLRRGRFAVRALTRTPHSDEAKALRAIGAEVVRGDLRDAASVRAALEGCYGVFGVTNFWEHFDGEYEQGINLVEAVSDACVGHFVFSTLPSVIQATRGELAVGHFDMKARMEACARVLDIPATYVHAAFYFENFLFFLPPVPQPDGSYVIASPQGDTPLAAVAVDDIGAAVATIFEQRAGFLGRTVRLAGDEQPMADYAAALTRATGRVIRPAYVPREVFAGYGFPGAEDAANMFEYYRRFVPSRQADIEATRALVPEAQRFASWAAAQGPVLAASLAVA